MRKFTPSPHRYCYQFTVDVTYADGTVKTFKNNRQYFTGADALVERLAGWSYKADYGPHLRHQVERNLPVGYAYYTTTRDIIRNALALPLGDMDITNGALIWQKRIPYSSDLFFVHDRPKPKLPYGLGC